MMSKAEAPTLGEVQRAVRRATHDDLGRRPTSHHRTVHLSAIDTPLGPMLLGTTETGVCLLEFAHSGAVDAQLEQLAQRLDTTFVHGVTKIGRTLEGELEAYFAGRLRHFETPLDLMGTEFQRRAWRALSQIPYGETRSYADQARAINAPRAVRAVARANGLNRIPIVVPCHRVVGRDGALTGYSGGLWRKRFLLDLELRHGTFA